MNIICVYAITYGLLKQTNQTNQINQTNETKEKLMTTTTSLMDLINSKREELKAKQAQRSTLKPKMGRSAYRILPTWRKDGKPEFWHDYGQHFIKGRDGQIKAVFTCPNRTFGEDHRCPVCEAISKAKKQVQGDPQLETLLSDCYAGKRVLLNVLEVEGDKPTTPQVLEVGPSVFMEILNTISEWGEEGILGFNNARNIIIERSGAGLNTRYSVIPSSSTSNVNPKVMSEIVNLDDFVARENEKTLNNALSSIWEVAGLIGNDTNGQGSQQAIGNDRPALAAVSSDVIDVSEVRSVQEATAAVRAGGGDDTQQNVSPFTNEELTMAPPASVNTKAMKQDELEQFLADLQ